MRRSIHAAARRNSCRTSAIHAGEDCISCATRNSSGVSRFPVRLAGRVSYARSRAYLACRAAAFLVRRSRTYRVPRSGTYRIPRSGIYRTSQSFAPRAQNSAKYIERAAGASRLPASILIRSLPSTRKSLRCRFPDNTRREYDCTRLRRGRDGWRRTGSFRLRVPSRGRRSRSCRSSERYKPW